MVVVNVTPLHRSPSPALPTMTTTDAHRHLLLSKVSKTVKYSLTYWLITHPAPYRFWRHGSGCHIATAISTTLTTPSDIFRPPTTPRHVFRAPYMHLNPSATCFDHLQPSDMRLDPSATRFDHLDTCFKPQTHISTLQQPVSTTYNHLNPSYNPQTCVSTPRQPVLMPLTRSCTPGPKTHVQLYMCFFIYIYCSYIAVIASYNTYLKTG